MATEAHASNDFEIEKCRAKIYGVIDLVECLALEQAILCGSSLPFGNGYFCKHSHRNEFSENTEKLQSKFDFLPGVSQSGNQE